ncbi:MAG TPA: hypothetical protein VFV01_16890 [Spirillospora sp.]|nr:hypothetical protein [Spirillospora sp.]
MADDIHVGSVAVDLVPDARQFNTRMAQIARNASVIVRVDADTRLAQERLDALERDRLLRLGAELDDAGIRERLDELTRDRTTRIRVDADTGGAQANIDRLSLSASGAGGGLSGLVAAGIALSPVLVEAGAAAAGAAVALGTLGAAGIAGIGVLGIAVAGVAGAFKALGQQQTAAQAAGAAAAASAASHAQAIRSAQQQITSAQYAMVQADQQESDAVKALTAARETAKRQLEDYANQQKDSALAAKQAQIDLVTAQQNYNTVMASSTATDLQKQQAALDLQKAQQGLVEANQSATRATEDNQKAQKAGVNGSPQVVAAQKQITDAQHAQQQASQNLANATQALADAQAKSAGSTSASLAKANAAVAALDPTTRRFAEYLRGTWGPIWEKVQATVSKGLLPGVQAGMEAMRPVMPLIAAAIGDVAQAMGSLAEQAGKALNSPFWRNFISFAGKEFSSAMQSLGTILGDIAKGFAGLFQAFAPIGNAVIGGMVSLSQRFADFGANAGSNSAFGKAMGYIRQSLPLIGQLIGGLLTFAGHLIEALAPLGPPLAKILDALIGLLNRIPTRVLTGLALAIIGVVAAQKAWSTVGSLGEMLGGLGAAGPWVAGLAALAAAVWLVYTHSKKFRDFVHDEVVPSLELWWQWIKTNILPVLNDLWGFIVNKLVPVLAGIFMAAWRGIQNAVKAVSDAVSGHRQQLGELWDGLKKLVSWIVANILPLVGTLLKFAFEVLGKAIGIVIDIVSELVSAWNTMWQLGKDIGNWFSGPFVNFFVTAWKTIRDGWSTLVQDIRNIFQDIEHWVMVPVAWVVRYVINDGLIKAWDWISDHLLGGALHATPMTVPKVPPLAAANGAVVPGYAPGVDSVHALLSPGEGVLVPEAVRGLGGAPAIHAINSAYSSRVPGGNGRFAGGGVVENIIRAISPAANIADMVGDQRVSAILSDPLGGLTAMVKGALSGLKAAGPFVQMLGDMATGLAKAAGKAVLHLVMPGGGTWADYLNGYNGANVAGAAGVRLPNLPSSSTLTALGRAGNAEAVRLAATPYGWGSGAEWNALEAVIMRESGFNNLAQNPTSTAYGMFQFLNSTWGAYGPKTSDPLLQSKYGMEYIAGRYHDPLGALAHEQAFGWYDQGGLVPPGPSLVYNGTGAPELIAPKQTFEQVMSGAGGGAGLRDVTVYAQFGTETIEARTVRVVDNVLGSVHDAVHTRVI